MKEDYDRVGKTRAAQKEFRLSWAHKQYDILKGTTKTKKSSFNDIDESIGEFVSVAEIYRKEGGESTNLRSFELTGPSRPRII